MILRHIYTTALAQASYLVGDPVTGEALVVDPTRDIDQYLALAAGDGLRVTAVAETHIHADFVSGARELAARAGARLYLSAAGFGGSPYAYAADAGAIPLRDGDRIALGDVRLDVLHTPGHTPESLSFLVTDAAGANGPMGILTGDCVFVGDVGRPDLLETAAGVAGAAAEGAHALFHSLQRVRRLPDYAQVWPGHGAGSACGRALGAVPQSTVGYETRFNWAFAVPDEDDFVREVLDGQPEPPPYFARMKRVNAEGPRPAGALPPPARLRADQLAGALAAGTVVVDLRPGSAYAAGHVPGALNLPLGGAFLSWAGWLLPDDRPLGLVGEEGPVDDAARQLRLIGLDTIVGAWTPAEVATWEAGGSALARVERIDAGHLRDLLARDEIALVDVRAPEEYAVGHISGSRNIPLGHLAERLGEIPAGRPLVVQCQGRTRSAIAASVVGAYRRDPIIDFSGGFMAWDALDYPVERGGAASTD